MVELDQLGRREVPRGLGGAAPLADRVAVESLLVVSGVLMFVVVTVAVALPSGRRAMRAAAQPG